MKINSFLRILKWMSSISRRKKQFTLVLIDCFIVQACLFGSFYIRLGHFNFSVYENPLFLLILFAPLLAIPIFLKFSLYHMIIQFLSYKALWQILKATSLYSILWGLLAFMGANWEAFPRSIVLINWVLVLTLIIIARFLIHFIYKISYRINNDDQKVRVLIYGAGSAGRQLMSALEVSNVHKNVGFLDDSDEIINQYINGLKVYSKNNLSDLIKKEQINEVLLAMPSISRKKRIEIFNFLDKFDIIVRTLPSISNLIEGKVAINDLLEIDVRDLLGREPVLPNIDLLKTNISNKVVLVSGAGGSIGSEICRQIIKLNAKKLILYEISESSLYNIDQELNSIKATNIEIFPVIGSVADKNRFELICNFYNVQTIYHAAAYKHVPLVEFNPSQGVLNNTIGTMIAAQVAMKTGVETFVLISTDKAVRPTNIMGATKRSAELVLQAFSELPHNTCFTMVRFGNVLDSSGSVIPLFKKQIKSGGPITVTHKNIVRFFMTIPEAVELVIQAGAMAVGGEVFLLDMGKPIKIYDLAVKMINLSGLRLLDKNNPDGDIEIKYTGLRPGEKLYEELLVGENSSITDNKLIMRAEEDFIDWHKLEPILIEIRQAAEQGKSEQISNLLKNLVPDYKKQINNH